MFFVMTLDQICVWTVIGDCKGNCELTVAGVLWIWIVLRSLFGPCDLQNQLLLTASEPLQAAVLVKNNPDKLTVH